MAFQKEVSKQGVNELSSACKRAPLATSTRAVEQRDALHEKTWEARKPEDSLVINSTTGSYVALAHEKANTKKRKGPNTREREGALKTPKSESQLVG